MGGGVSSSKLAEDFPREDWQVLESICEKKGCDDMSSVDDQTRCFEEGCREVFVVFFT
jgi:hypothetical protein